jgi:biopolymer transport protein ExbD
MRCGPASIGNFSVAQESTSAGKELEVEEVAMPGVSVEGGKSGRRSLDSEINMIPMIDLLMVTISFLLITAVWVQAQRLEANANVPGPPTTPPCEGDCKEEAKLHVETEDPTKFVLAWKQGRTVLRTTDVPRETARRNTASFPSLAAKVSDEWKTSGHHHEASDKQFDAPSFMPRTTCPTRRSSP